MLRGVAVIPSAPLLVPAIAPGLPAGLAQVRRHVADVLAGLPAADVTVLVAAGAPGVHAGARVALRGVGRGDLDHERPVCPAAVEMLAHATGLARRDDELPLDLAVLACLSGRDAAHGRLAGGPAVAALAVDGSTPGGDLVAVGQAIAERLHDETLRTVLVAAGDGSAGLSWEAPRQVLAGAGRWEEHFAAALGSAGELDALGPAEAARVAARGWASALVASAAAASAGLALRLHRHTAPRGVGYVVASSA